MVIKMKILFLVFFIDNISDYDILIVFDLSMSNEKKKGFVFEINPLAAQMKFFNVRDVFNPIEFSLSHLERYNPFFDIPFDGILCMKQLKNI